MTDAASEALKHEIKLTALELGPLADPAVFEAYEKTQPGWRREKTRALRRPADRMQSLGAGILLQRALPGVDLEAARFGENGKPWLPGADIHFNLSHAGLWALCAVGNAPLGCDVEILREARMSVARRFFCEEETALLESAPTREARQDLFFRLWTLKESYIKAVGKGLSAPLASFCVTFDHGVPALRGLEDTWRLREYDLAPGCRCALCAPAHALLPEAVEIITIE